MAEAETKRTRNEIDVSNIVMLEDVKPPQLYRDSKYPWHEIFGKPGAAFFVPFDSEEEAKSSRAGIQASGNNFVDKRELPARALCRVLQNEGQWGVGCWLIMEFDEDTDSDGEANGEVKTEEKTKK